MANPRLLCMVVRPTGLQHFHAWSSLKLPNSVPYSAVITGSKKTRQWGSELPMWTSAFSLALGSLIVALGAFLLSVLSKLESSHNRHNGIKLEFEHRKQAVVGILSQGQTLEQSRFLSLRLIQIGAARSKLAFQRLPKIKLMISDTQKNNCRLRKHDQAVRRN